MRDQHVQLLEATLVEELFQTLSGGELAFLMLLGHSLGPAPLPGLLLEPA